YICHRTLHRYGARDEDSLANPAFRRMVEDGIEEAPGTVVVCARSQLPGYYRSHRDRHCAGYAFRVSVRDKRGSSRLLRTSLQIVREVPAQGSDAHGAAVAH